MKKSKSLRWGIGEAAAEFRIDRSTLSARLKTSGVSPGDDGKFGTVEIAEAIYGSMFKEKLRLARATADTAEREGLKQQGRLLDSGQVMDAWSQIILTAKKRLQMIPSKAQSRMSLTPAQAKIIQEEIDGALAEISREPDYA